MSVYFLVERSKESDKQYLLASMVLCNYEDPLKSVAYIFCTGVFVKASEKDTYPDDGENDYCYCPISFYCNKMCVLLL